MDWKIILYALGAALLIWLGTRFIKNNPKLFSKEALGKSLTTVGFLALLIIAVVAFAVFMLRQ